MNQIRETILNNVIGNFVDTYVFQGLPSSEDDDFVKNYTLCFIYLTLVILQLKDTAAEGDGDRNIMNKKLLLSIFSPLDSTASMHLKCAWSGMEDKEEILKMTSCKRSVIDLAKKLFNAWEPTKLLMR